MLPITHATVQAPARLWVSLSIAVIASIFTVLYADLSALLIASALWTGVVSDWYCAHEPSARNLPARRRHVPEHQTRFSLPLPRDSWA